MDKYIKWIIILLIFLGLSVFLIIYFGFYYDFDNDDNGEASLSPALILFNGTNETNENNSLIENKEFKGFERDIPGTFRAEDEIEKGNKDVKNQTNQTGYWIENLPDSDGGGTYTITTLVTYEDTYGGQRILFYMLLFTGVVIYIILKIIKNEKSKIRKVNLENNFYKSFSHRF